MIITPGDALQRFARAVGLGALAAAVLLAALRAALLDTGIGNAVEFVVGLLLGGAVAVSAWLLAAALMRLLGRLPAALTCGLVAAGLTAWVFDSQSVAEILVVLLDPESWSWPFTRPDGLDLLSVLVIVTAAGLLTGLGVLMATGAWTVLGNRLRLWIGGTTAALTAAAVALVAVLAGDGTDPYPSEFSSVAGAAGSTMPNPAVPGAFGVDTLTYGAGDNPRRPEFGAERDLDSRTVDATKILPEWKDIKARMRERYWGFGLDSAPLNGTVYAPRGDGPFPLALIVHGNHDMEDYSDGGYAYIGELLASRGIIAVSVDQNYINGSWSGDFRGKEMAARAWLLLEHLAQWRDWNDDPDHRFGARVDMQRIALIGHSRGGEAVSIAYAFNELDRFPDDATVAFDYGFGIEALAAIAQVDQRYHRRVRLDNVNFLALQGSYDSDEPAFHGLRQFNRITLSGDAYRFKAGIYIHGANHGQFNSTWGRYDYGPPEAWLLNTAAIIPAEDQRRIAAGYLSAFAEATLHGDVRYLALFRDPRAGAGWLPDHPYVHQFTDSEHLALANFEEDLDPATGSAAGVTIDAQGFSVWREEPLLHRDERAQGSSAVVLGQSGDGASYTVNVPADYWRDVGEADFLALSVARSTEKLSDEEADEEAGESDDSTPGPPIVHIEGVLDDNSVHGVSSTAVAALAPPLRVQFLKHAANNEQSYNDTWEPVLQYLEVPLASLTGGAAVAAIRAIRLRIDDSPGGVIIVDDIGIRRRPIGPNEEAP